jgi:HEAT repeat protein
MGFGEWCFASISLFSINCFTFFDKVACSQEGVRPVTVTEKSIVTETSAREFRIYRDALQQGSTEDIRVDAAVVLLVQNDEQGRGALLSALRSEENPQARKAVCQALIKSRGLSQTIDSLEVFQEPLLAILQSESAEEAELAAEAMLLYDYADVAAPLDQILQNEERGSRVRMNAIYALRLRTEPTALRRLIKLLDDPDAEVAKAAETALQEAFGIPVGANREVWTGILDDLQLKSPDDIRRERLLRQEMKLRQVQAERDRWQKLYLSALDKQYEVLDETSRKETILDMIESDLDPVRIWALDNASKYPVVDEVLREKLLSLLSDGSRDVRLQAAKALMNMSAINPAAALLERLQIEEDAEVRLAMLEALGEACFFAFSPGSDVELPKDIKLQTLEIASGYLQSESEDECIKGAEVLRKILELNNLTKDSMQSYLGLLDERYRKSLYQDEGVRAKLLRAAVSGCGGR